MIRLLSYLLTAYVRLLQWTCRIEIHDDPRMELRASNSNYLFAGLHAHQIAIIVKPEPGTGALVSRSKDGELIANVLEATDVQPIRGSSGARRKGGAAAFRELVNHVNSGRPAYVAVDGPKGPRGSVQPGIAKLSQTTGIPVLPLVFIPKWRLVISAAWDRLQIPLPFSKLVARFGEPLYTRDGESLEQYKRRIENSLRELEWLADPREAAIAESRAESDQYATNSRMAA
ncbi:MAG: lysophospholipid acyltransferase family protein [Planctomycetota bacterium]